MSKHSVELPPISARRCLGEYESPVSLQSRNFETDMLDTLDHMRTLETKLQAKLHNLNRFRFVVTLFMVFFATTLSLHIIQTKGRVELNDYKA
jgi:hypothetical protein